MFNKKKKIKNQIFFSCFLLLSLTTIYFYWFFQPYVDFFNKQGLWNLWLYPKKVFLTSIQLKSTFVPQFYCVKSKFIKKYFQTLPSCENNRALYFKELKKACRKPKFLFLRKKFVGFWNKVDQEKLFNLSLKELFVLIYKTN